MLGKQGISALVLILVLMEDALRGDLLLEDVTYHYVLILVLMEDALRGCLSLYSRATFCVLILVLMEDALRVRARCC